MERAERAEPAAGLGQRVVVHEWVEQQQAGAWEARAISAEAANRDLEARLSKAINNEDRRDADLRLADVTKERDRLATKVRENSGARHGDVVQGKASGTGSTGRVGALGCRGPPG